MKTFSYLLLLLMVVFLSTGILTAQDKTATDYYEEGVEVYWTDDYAAALELFNQALELEPDYVDALAYRCSTYRVLTLEAGAGRYADALQDCNRALELDPESGLAYTMRSRLYLESSFEGYDTDQALADANQGVEFAPDLWLVYYNRGRVFYVLENYEEASVDLGKVTELNPAFIPVYNYFLEVLFYLEEYDEGVEYTTRALELSPDAGDAYFYGIRGYFYQTMEQYEDALADFTHALDISPEYTGIHINIGFVYTLMGDMDNALANYLIWLNSLGEHIEHDPIIPGETITIEMQPGAVYAIPFDMQADTPVTITATATDGHVDSLIFIFDAEGNALAFNDEIDPQSDEDDMNAAIEDFQVSEAGTYTLIVTHAGGGYEGSIEVLLESGE